MSVGQLLVEFVASTAKYQEDLGKAAQQSEATAKRIEASLNGAFDSIKEHAKGALVALAGGFSAHAFEEMIKGAIDAQENLALVGERAGLSGAQLSSLSAAARHSHTDLADVASMSAKLSKALLDFSNDGAKSTIVLKALGVTSDEVAKLLENPAEATLRFAKLINDLPEGGTKAAAQLLVLGKAGGTTSAFLNELAKQTELVQVRTNEQIKAAREFNDKLTDMQIRTEGLKTAFANALLPVLSDTVDAFTAMTTGAGGLRAKIDELAADGSLKEWARDAAVAIATVAESLIFASRAGFAFTSSLAVVAADVRVGGAFLNKRVGGDTADAKAAEDAYQHAVEARNRTLESANQRYEDLVNKNAAFVTDALKKQFALSDAVERAAKDLPQNSDANDRLNARNLGTAAADRQAEAAKKAKAIQDALNRGNKLANPNADDPARKILEANLKALEGDIELEKQALTGRDEFLRAYYEQGDISLKKFYAERNASLSEGLAFTEKALDEEVAAVLAFQRAKDNANNPTRQKDLAEGEIKLVEIAKRRALAEGAASKASIALWFEDRAAAEAYRHELGAIEAELLSLQGKTADAAAIRFRDAHEDIRKKLQATVRGDDPAEAAKAQAALDQIDQTEKITNAQAKLNEEVTRGNLAYDELGNTVARIDSLRNHGDISELDYLGRISAANRAMLPVLQENIDKQQAIANTLGGEEGRKAQVEVDKLRVKLEELANSSDLVKERFDNIFTDNIATAIDEIVHKTKSLKDAVKDMASSIEHSITKLIAEDLSKRLYKSLFGGADSATGLDLGGIFSKLFGLGSGSSANTFGSLFDASSTFGFAPFASGTNFAPGGLSLVGEKGPELVNLPRGAQVIPNDVLRASSGAKSNVIHITQNISVPTGTSRATASQLLAEGANQIARASRRLN